MAISVQVIVKPTGFQTTLLRKGLSWQRGTEPLDSAKVASKSGANRVSFRVFTWVNPTTTLTDCYRDLNTYFLSTIRNTG